MSINQLNSQISKSFLSTVAEPGQTPNGESIHSLIPSGLQEGTSSEGLSNKVLTPGKENGRWENIITALFGRACLNLDKSLLVQPKEISEQLTQIEDISACFVRYSCRNHKFSTGVEVTPENQKALTAQFAFKLIALTQNADLIDAAVNNDETTFTYQFEEEIKAIGTAMKNDLEKAVEESHLKKKTDLLEAPKQNKEEIPAQKVGGKKTPFNFVNSLRKNFLGSSAAFSAETVFFLNFIPPELLFSIFSFLSPRDLVTCSLVSHEWNQLSEQEALWKTLAKKMGCPNSTPGISSKQFLKKSLQQEKQRSSRLKPLSLKLSKAQKKIDNPLFSSSNTLAQAALDIVNSAHYSASLVAHSLFPSSYSFNSFKPEALIDELYAYCFNQIQKENDDEFSNDQMTTVAEAFLFWLIAPTGDLPLLKEIIQRYPTLKPFLDDEDESDELRSQLYSLFSSHESYMRNAITALGHLIAQEGAAELFPLFMKCLDNLSFFCSTIEERLFFESLPQNILKTASEKKQKELIASFKEYYASNKKAKPRTREMIEGSIQYAIAQRSPRPIYQTLTQNLSHRQNALIGSVEKALIYSAITAGTGGGAFLDYLFKTAFNSHTGRSLREALLAQRTKQNHGTTEQVLDEAIEKAVQERDFSLLRDLLTLKEECGLLTNPYVEKTPDALEKPGRNVLKFFQAVEEGNADYVEKALRLDLEIIASPKFLSDALALSLMYQENESHQKILSLLLQFEKTPEFVLQESYDEIYIKALRGHDFDRYDRLTRSVPYLKPSSSEESATLSLFKRLQGKK
jgi:hypothetical protein